MTKTRIFRTDSSPPISPETEYSALRDEILQRAKFQQQTVHLAVILAGSLFTVFFQFRGSPWVLLTYPLLTAVLAAEWGFNNVRIMQIGGYIRSHLEHDYEGWEHFLSTLKRQGIRTWLSGAILAYGIFVVLPIIAILLVVQQLAVLGTLERILAILDSVLVLIVSPILIHTSEARTWSEQVRAETAQPGAPADRGQPGPPPPSAPIS
jgi:hypothetical protein